MKKILTAKGNSNEAESLMSGDSSSHSLYASNGGNATSPTNGSNTTVAAEGNHYIETDVPILSQFHEDAIKQAGTGRFQYLLLLVTGLCLAGDTIELFVVSYLIPSAEVEFCLTGVMKIWLAAVTFIGMMFGAIIWGALGDSIGRRKALLSALLFNGVFGLVSAFMPTYSTFFVTRLCSGVGIGGGIPIVFAYFSEFLTKHHRGRYLTYLLVWWAIGGVFTALVAWLIIPRTGISVVLDELHHFSSWRVFLVVCSLPVFAAVIGLFFMPESPRYLLEQGRDVEAIMVYKKIFQMNSSHLSGTEYQLTELELPQSIRLPNIEEQDRTQLMQNISSYFSKVYSLVHHLTSPPYRHITAVLMTVWFATAFGFYGLAIWFPEYIKQIKMEEYDKNVTRVVGKVYMNEKFSTALENTRYVNTTFNNVTFEGIIMSHVVFDGCSIFDCKFSDIRSSQTYFRNAYVARNLFIDTNMFEYRFQNCDMKDKGNIFKGLMPGCQLDFDYNIHYNDVFQEHLIGQLTLIPGTMLSTAFLLEHVGRVKIMSASFILSAVAGFFIWFLDTKISIIFFEAIFNFIFISGWNALDIATTESYPTHIRTSAYGLLSSVSRIAGVMGTLIFGQFIHVNRAIPMLTTCAVLLMAGIVALKLPETKDNFV